MDPGRFVGWLTSTFFSFAEVEAVLKDTVDDTVNEDQTDAATDGLFNVTKDCNG